MNKSFFILKRIVNRYTLSAFICAIVALIAVGCSVTSEESSYSADSDKSLLYGYSDLMISENINPSVYTGTFYKIDVERNDSAVPENFRTVFNSPSISKEAKGGTSETYEPSLTGLTEVKMSGSAEFNENQIDELISKIKPYHSGDICIVDLRQESHFLVNGRSISWYGLRNWGNIGKNLSEVTSAENSHMENIKNTTIDVYKLVDDQPSNQELIVANDVKSEKVAVESHGLDYYRIPCTDHVSPTDEEIDIFINFVKSLSDNTWLHFHCQAGKGRTTFFMVVYDMMLNPTVSLQDIAYRQYAIGGSEILQNSSGSTENNDRPKGANDDNANDLVLKTSSDNWKSLYSAEKVETLELFYQYVQDNYKSNYDVSFTEWKVDYKQE